MKPINKYRHTTKFCLTGTRIDKLVLIHNWAKTVKHHLIAVAPTEGGKDLYDYTVRVIKGNGGIWDYTLTLGTCDEVTVVESKHVGG